MKTGDSHIFRAVAAFLFFLINVFSLYLLWRGHNLPGGGFIGGLGSALSLVMLSLAFGVRRAQEILRVDPLRLAAFGLLLAVLTALLPLLFGDPLLRHYHGKFAAGLLPGGIAIGTPFVFDLGVYLVVVGVTVKLIFALSRPANGLTAIEPAERRRYAAAREQPIEASPRRNPEERR